MTSIPVQSVFPLGRSGIQDEVEALIPRDPEGLLSDTHELHAQIVLTDFPEHPDMRAGDLYVDPEELSLRIDFHPPKNVPRHYTLYHCEPALRQSLSMAPSGTL